MCLLGYYALADKHRHHGRHQIAAAVDEDACAVAADRPYLGELAQGFEVEGAGRAEADPLAHPGAERRGRVNRDHAAVVQQSDAITEMFCLFHEVRHEDHGHALVTDALNQLPGFAARLRIESGGELVEDRQLRTADQGERDR